MRPAEPVAKFRCEGTLERELRARGFPLRGRSGRGRPRRLVRPRGGGGGDPFAGPPRARPERQQTARRRSAARCWPARIRERAVAWAVAAVDAATIDCINIYQASRLAMRTAVERPAPAPPISCWSTPCPLDLPLPQRALIKGDARCHAIAAASILAKVSATPGCGSGTKSSPSTAWPHTKAMPPRSTRGRSSEYGPTPLHRLSFEPVRACSLFPVDAADGPVLAGSRRCRRPTHPWAKPSRSRRRPPARLPLVSQDLRAAVHRLLPGDRAVPADLSLDGCLGRRISSPRWCRSGTAGGTNAYVRGAVSGVGVLNLYISFLEIFRLRRFSR